jgi:hypothetical protein
VHNGNTLEARINGVMGANIKTIYTSLYSGTAKMMIGTRQLSTEIQYPIAEIIDNVHITKGVA